MSVTVEPAALPPRVRIVLQGRVNGDDVANAFILLYAEHPEAAYYDRLFDLTAYRSGFDLTHLQRIASAYRRANTDPCRPCRTALVSSDTHLGLWAASMGYQFQGREHRAFDNLTEAERFLATPLTERSPFPSA